MILLNPKDAGSYGIAYLIYIIEVETEYTYP